MGENVHGCFFYFFHGPADRNTEPIFALNGSNDASPDKLT